MKKILLTIILILVIGCESNKAKNLFGKIVTERVYDLDNNGNKKDLILIIKGNKMYTSNEKGDKIEFILEKIDNKVYEIKHKVIENTLLTEKGRILYIFEGDKYWEYNKRTKQKGKLIFVREGNTIYQNRKNKLEKVLIVD